MRTIDPREYIHERLGEKFGQHLSQYDTTRRVEILAGEFLRDLPTHGARALDVGCGLGFFSAALRDLGCQVTACDLGPELVERTRARVRCEGVVADALNLVQQFGPNRFDIVLSSECIEHTPDPPRAIEQMIQVLAPGGYLSLSTPNLLWWPVVKAATLLKLRPFDGFENFSTWRKLRATIEAAGATVIREKGLHLFPFQLRQHALSRFLDERAQPLRAAMINLCILARKRPA